MRGGPSAGGDALAPRLPPHFFSRPIAHRGLHGLDPGVVENSRAACDAAAAAGYAIEIDVQSSADGEAIVFHDDRLERMTGAEGRVRDKRADELAALALLGADESPPTLAEILALVSARVPIVVEIKDQSGAFGPEIGPLEARVAALLRRYDGPAALMSFNPHSVAAAAEAAPDVARGLVASSLAEAQLSPERRAALSGVADADALDVDFISYRWSDLPTPAVDAFRARGRPVVTWTIRSPAEAETARARCDQITFEGFRA